MSFFERAKAAATDLAAKADVAMNQAGALVSVYTDGSIRLNHGGTEMGQGLFIKVAQVVADVFGVGVERTFPVHSPIIEKIEVVTKGDVRRAKLYYMRALRGKAAKIKEKRDFSTAK